MKLPAARTSATVFRVVDAAEASSIKTTGQFLLKEGGAEVKYFARTLEDAHWHGSRLYPDGYIVVEGTIKALLM